MDFDRARWRAATIKLRTSTDHSSRVLHQVLANHGAIDLWWDVCTPLARDDQPSLLFILGRRVGFVRRWRGSARVHHEVDHEVDPHMSRVRVLAAVRAGAHILHGLFSREAWT